MYLLLFKQLLRTTLCCLGPWLVPFLITGLGNNTPIIGLQFRIALIQAVGLGREACGLTELSLV